MTTAEILAEFPQAPRAGGRRRVPGPLVPLRSGARRTVARNRHSAHRRGGHRGHSGAAGTVANNVAALGAGRVACWGGRATTASATNWRGRLTARGISADLLVEAPEVPTFTYTKLINCRTGAEDLPRVDFVNTRAAAGGSRTGIGRALGARRGGLRRDPGLRPGRDESGGVVTPAMREAIARAARSHRER